MSEANIERRMLHAYLAGRAGAEAGDNRNPYNGGSGDPRERVLALVWRRAYGSVAERTLAR